MPMQQKVEEQKTAFVSAQPYCVIWIGDTHAVPSSALFQPQMADKVFNFA